MTVLALNMSVFIRCIEHDSVVNEHRINIINQDSVGIKHGIIYIKHASIQLFVQTLNPQSRFGVEVFSV